MSRSSKFPGVAGGRLALVAICALALGACASQGTRPGAVGGDAATTSSKSSPEEQVKQRAVARWNLLIERRFDEAYELMSPGYRQTMAKDLYLKTMKDRPVKWTGVSFLAATCEPEVCSVRLTIDAEFKMPVMRVGTVEVQDIVTENWVLNDGEWYMVPDAEL